ncbi:MAG: 2-dehydropantoate 2-reductase [Chloroflexi bacterium]|nr:2-dehydropantoate 2-reductase [Chloroflexota bacterium]
MRIAVVGAGAIGGFVGGLLAKAGEDVTLIDRWQEHVEAINLNGLQITGFLGEMNIKVKAAEKLNFAPDLMLLAVKTHSVVKACEDIKPVFGNCPVVTMQNGVRSDELAASVLGKEHIISCVIFFGGITCLEPGKIQANAARGLMVSEAFQSNGDRVRKIAAILSKAVNTTVCDTIHEAHWTKLMINLTNCIPAVTGLSAQECGENPPLARLGVLLMKEGVRVAEKAKMKLVPLPKLPVGKFRFFLKLPVSLAIPLLRRYVPSGVSGRALGKTPVYGSTLLSIKRGEKTEIDYLNGEIIEAGARLDVPTPYNTAMTELVHRVEETRVFLTPEEVIREVNRLRVVSPKAVLSAKKG